MRLFNPPAVDGPMGILALLIWLLIMAIFFRAILSWFIRDPYNPIVQALNAITEPILEPLRRVIPRMGLIDISPLVAIIVLSVISSMLSGI